MKKLTKVSVALMIIAMMVLSLAMRKSIANAPQNTGNYVQLSFGGDVTAIENAENVDTVTISYEHGSVTVTGSGLYSALEQGPNGNGETVNKFNVYAIGNVTITANANQGFTASYFVNGTPMNTTTLNYTLAAGDGPKSIDAIFDGQPGGADDITLDVQFDDTHMIGLLNGITFMDDVQELQNTFQGVLEAAGTTDANETNTFRFINVFGDAPILTYTINGVDYTRESAEVTVDQDGWDLITVPGAESYTIRGVIDPDFVRPRTIIWVNPNYVPTSPENEDWIQEFKLENGYGYVKAVYDPEGNLLDPDTYTAPNFVFNENGGVGEDGFGWIELQGPGAKVEFEFVPEYGYQLTDIRINGQKLGVSGLVNTFEFIMPNTNIHFDAEFSPVDDVVKAESDSVSEGTIQLPDGTIDNGTAQLTVSDVDLSEDKVKGFQDAAGDYTVATFLDIDLYQVFYKGKDDSDDVWSSKIDEIDGEAVITLKLAEGVSAEDIVIVHNIHDGDEYEVIQIDSYDETTNTITFRAKSFSGYAIATKGTSKAKLPKTGDSIIAILVAITITTIALIAIAKVKKNTK